MPFSTIFRIKYAVLFLSKGKLCTFSCLSKGKLGFLVKYARFGFLVSIMPVFRFSGQNSRLGLCPPAY